MGGGVEPTWTDRQQLHSVPARARQPKLELGPNKLGVHPEPLAPPHKPETAKLTALEPANALRPQAAFGNGTSAKASIGRGGPQPSSAP